MHRLLAVLFIVPAGFASAERAHARDQPAKDSVDVAVTVLDEKIYLRPTDPSLVAQHRAKLSARAFAKWQSQSRWRPLVSKVSYHVMSDWANKNVRPTREEIGELFRKEAKQHLQAYATPDEGKRVSQAVGMATGMAFFEWATAKALYEKYGGCIALSSFGGCISIEGRNALLKEYATAGKIRFHDPEIETLFWEGVANPAVLDVTISDPKRVARHFEQPPWIGWGIRTAARFKENPKLFKILKDEQDQTTEKVPANKRQG